jgi:hypothetical protein
MNKSHSDVVMVEIKCECKESPIGTVFLHTGMINNKRKISRLWQTHIHK